MQLSTFLKTYTFPDDPALLLLYSTKNAALAIISQKIFTEIQQGRLPQDYQKTLIELGMLVPDRHQEQKEVLQMPAALNRLNNSLTAAVILGMECNFSCVYCYEGSMKGKKAMSDTTAEHVVAFLKNRFGPDKKKMILDFYGGEPLLYFKRISYFAKSLKPFVEERGGEFFFTLVTNGSLLTRKTVEKLAPLGLRSVKITIDGPPENHNRYRPFKSGKGSFDVILNNVRDCCGLTRIWLGGNFTSDNFQTFPALLDLLEATGITPDHLAQVKFDPVMQTNDTFSNPEFTGGCGSINEPWLQDASLFIREEILKRGYKTPKLSPSSCMVDLDDSFTIHYDGGLYKCVSLVGHPEFEAGTVWDGFKDYKEMYNVHNRVGEEDCKECEYLPLCFGGCRYMEYQRTGNMRRVDCQKEYLDATLEAMLTQDVRYRYRPA
jgi:uncharacterized protein